MRQAKRIVGKKRTEKVTGLELRGAAKPVDIGTTKWMSAAERGGKGRGGLLVDRSGKAVTGTVTLPSGQSAMYVRGKRIGVARATPQKKTSRAPSKTGATSKQGYVPMTRKNPAVAGSVAPSVAARQSKFSGASTLPSKAAGPTRKKSDESWWSSLSTPQKVAYAAAVAYPVTRIPALLAGGYLTARDLRKVRGRQGKR